ENGSIAAGMFDHLIIKEDDDRRGREAGAVAALVRQGAREAGMPDEHMTEVLDELEAVQYGLNMAQPGDLLVVFADNITPVWKTVIYHGKAEWGA
ncbi:MAG TPA: hypothetical protein VFT99_00895, partial [Roseiflexaceae bacterium]|nr:hypothetical protein [Roseiflexaceae bacterium]